MEQKQIPPAHAHSNAIQPDPRVYTFFRKNTRWHIYFSGYLERGGRREDIRMEAGADDLLDLLSRGKRKVTVMIDTEPFPGSETLELSELCEAPEGGGFYLLSTLQGRELNKRIWVRDIALLLFGDIPERIFISRIKRPLP